MSIVSAIFDPQRHRKTASLSFLASFFEGFLLRLNCYTVLVNGICVGQLVTTCVIPDNSCVSAEKQIFRYYGDKTVKLNPMDLYNLLPKTNCRLCEPKTCMAFATKLALGDVSPDDCPPLLEPDFEKNLEKLRELVAPMLSAEETGIKLDETKCTGCNNCVVVCPVDVAAEPPTSEGRAAMSTDTVFRIENGVSKIINLEKCRRFPPDRLNCRVCEQYCCTDAIEIW
jgi:4Fe-4S ferredoxin